VGCPELLVMEGKVLLVSDCADVAQVWAFALGRRGIGCRFVDSAELASECTEHPPDIVLVDLYGVESDALRVCRQLREHVANPVLLLTGSGQEAHLLGAYEAGFDECIVRPISPPLLLAKVAAWLRRAWGISTDALEPLQRGDLRLVPDGRALVFPDGDAVRLTNLEFRLMYALMSSPGRPRQSEVLLERVWGYGAGDSAVLKNAIYHLRRKVEPDPSRPRYIQTAPTGGYVFEA
jgi:two-component system response regulator MtrA